MMNMVTMKNMSGVNEIAANIRMLLMDVDGVLTDGKVFGVPDPRATSSRPKASTRRTASRCSGSPGRAW
jgi:hypothetical protein